MELLAYMQLLKSVEGGTMTWGYGYKVRPVFYDYWVTILSA